MIEQAVILAAGLPWQVGNITEGRTRAMLPILGKPFAARIMEALRRLGVNNFTVVLGPRDDLLATYLTESWYPDAEIHFAMHTGPEGTANALLSAREYFNGAMIVVAVEHLLTIRHYERVINTFISRETEPAIAISYGMHTEKHRATLSGSQIAAITKTEDESLPSVLSTAVLPAGYVGALSASDVTERSAVSLAQRFQQEVAVGTQMNGVVVDDVQTLMTAQDLLSINRYFLDDGIGSYILCELDASVTVYPPVRIDPHVRVGNGAVVGPYVYLESGARVGAGATVRSSVVLRRGTVPENQLCEHLVVSKGR